MPRPLLLRTATSADATVLADVYLASRRTFLPYAPLAHSEKEVRDWVRAVLVPTHDVTVAEEDGTILGMMALRREEGIGWIEQLYLLPGAVGRGIGSRLVEQAKGTLGPPLRLYAFQANTGARRFYERHGFIAIAWGDGTGNEEKCPDVLYEWRGQP